MITEASYFAGVAVLAARLISYKNSRLVVTRTVAKLTAGGRLFPAPSPFFMHRTNKEDSK